MTGASLLFPRVLRHTTRTFLRPSHRKALSSAGGLCPCSLRIMFSLESVSQRSLMGLLRCLVRRPLRTRGDLQGPLSRGFLPAVFLSQRSQVSHRSNDHEKGSSNIFIPLYLRLDALHVHILAFLSANISSRFCSFSVSWFLASDSTTPVLKWLLDFVLHTRIDSMDMPEVHDIDINGQITVIFNVTSCQCPYTRCRRYL